MNQNMSISLQGEEIIFNLKFSISNKFLNSKKNTDSGFMIHDSGVLKLVTFLNTRYWILSTFANYILLTTCF